MFRRSIRRKIAVFELLGQKGEVTSPQNLLRTRYAEGLTAYRERRWQDAHSAFATALEAVPGDEPSMAFLRRIDELQKDPPSADWDGSWRLENK